MDPQLELIWKLGTALAIGLLIGIERGWHGRTEDEGDRVAGIRTFSLSGLLGGINTLHRGVDLRVGFHCFHRVDHRFLCV